MIPTLTQKERKPKLYRHLHKKRGSLKLYRDLHRRRGSLNNTDTYTEREEA